MISPADKSSLMKVMVFYALLTYALAPGAGFMLKKNKEGITQGMIVGSVISLALWYKYGSKMITLQ